ncbi:MAG TPA: NAD-dependent epimerase/dehydratase family protein [Solirubrobacterales bacterium]|nr:NAD-dependent epimerase/dehydratase family protein [Solirubrobacterales bacterium]
MSNAPIPEGRTARDGQGARILLVGCGFIGSHVVEELARGSRPPVVLTRSRPASAVASLIPEGDLHLGGAQDPEILERALEGVGHVVFTAGGLLPAASEENPELDARLTLEPVRAVLAALAERPGITLTYLSSGGTVYGEPATVPIDEEAPTEPVGAYGRLHLACEKEVMAAHRERGLDVRILRCATVYGEHQRPDRGQGAVVTFLHRIEHGEPVHLFGDGGTIRDYVYAGDVAAAIVQLLGCRDVSPVLNLGSGEGTSLAEVLALAEKEVGRRANVVRHPARDFEVHRIVLDTSRLRGLIDFEPTPLETGIARTHCWLTSGAVEKV